METDDRLRCLKQLLQTYTAERSGGWDTTVLRSRIVPVDGSVTGANLDL